MAAPNFKTPRIRGKRHMDWVRGLPCVVTGLQIAVQVHHLQHAELSAMSAKSSDCYVVPLDFRMHESLHRAACQEHLWWQARGIDALRIADLLWCYSIADGRVRKDRHVIEALRQTLPDFGAWVAGGYQIARKAA